LNIGPSIRNVNPFLKIFVAPYSTRMSRNGASNSLASDDSRQGSHRAHVGLDVRSRRRSHRRRTALSRP
jgi:hypothetical protein